MWRFGLGSGIRQLNRRGQGPYLARIGGVPSGVTRFDFFLGSFRNGSLPHFYRGIRADFGHASRNDPLATLVVVNSLASKGRQLR